MDEKVFIYLRLVLGTETLAKSKIRELAGLGSLLAQFLHRTLEQGVELPDEFAEGIAEGITEGSAQVQIPALDYVDANTEEVLIRFRADASQQVQVIEGRIPPPYQARMLDPSTSQVSLQSFAQRVSDDPPDQKRRELSERLARAQINVLDRIRDAMDDEGRFEVRVPA